MGRPKASERACAPGVAFTPTTLPAIVSEGGKSRVGLVDAAQDRVVGKPSSTSTITPVPTATISDRHSRRRHRTRDDTRGHERPSSCQRSLIRFRTKRVILFREVVCGRRVRRGPYGR